MLAISVIMNLQNRVVSQHTFNLYMKVSVMFVTSVTNNLHTRLPWQDIFNVNKCLKDDVIMNKNYEYYLDHLETSYFGRKEASVSSAKSTWSWSALPAQHFHCMQKSYMRKRETTSLKNQISIFSRRSFNIPVASYSWKAKFWSGCFQRFPMSPPPFENWYLVFLFINQFLPNKPI